MDRAPSLKAKMLANESLIQKRKGNWTILLEVDEEQARFLLSVLMHVSFFTISLERPLA